MPGFGSQGLGVMKFEKGLGTQLLIRLLIPIVFLSIVGVSIIQQNPQQEAKAQELTSAVVYPKEITTDKEKLFAVYSIIEQMRLEHNIAGQLALSDWKANQGKWYLYTQIFWTKYRPLLAEQVRLRQLIRKEVYDDKTWEVLTVEQKDAAFIPMYGDKETLKEQPTLASSPSLDQLKAIDFGSLNARAPPDPLEDWTGVDYVEDDDSGVLTVEANTLTVVDMQPQSDGYLYKDHGAAHFGTVLSNPHLLQTEITACSGEGPMVLIHVLSNSTTPNFSTDPMIAVRWYKPASWPILTLMIDDGATDTDDSYTYGQSLPAPKLWLSFNRDGDGTTLAIYSDAYTTLVDTLAVPQGSTSFRYLQSSGPRGGSSSATMSTKVHDLDLQEAADPDITGAPASHNYGIVAESSTSNTSLDNFWVVNNSGFAITITIKGTDFTGGAGWTLSDTATAGGDTAGMKAGLNGGSFNITIKKTAPYNTLIAGMADSANQSWGLQLLAPTSHSDGAQKTSTVTLTATAD